MAAESSHIASGSISLPAELENLDAMRAHLLECARQFGLEPRRTGLLSVALEEIFINICHYAYPQGPGPVYLSCCSEGGRLLVEIVDEGQAFDAAAVAAPDLETDLESRKIGGLGWFIVRQVVDELHCFRESGRNIVRLGLNR
jgi:anti-sigma regulatory factor (Ser/Thr protein kinase)